MIYESHVTIDLLPRQQDEWVRFCAERGIKPLKFSFWGAPVADQVMCAYQFKAHSRDLAVHKAALLTDAIALNFDVLRVKLESPLYSYGGEDYDYFESHIKFLVGENFDLNRLAGAGVGISVAEWNNIGTTRKVYITKRMVGQYEVYNEFNQFYQGYLGFAPISVENEVVLFDTCPELDGEWCLVPQYI